MRSCRGSKSCARNNCNGTTTLINGTTVCVCVDHATDCRPISGSSMLLPLWHGVGEKVKDTFHHHRGGMGKDDVYFRTNVLFLKPVFMLCCSTTPYTHK